VKTELAVHRRDVLVTALAGLMISPALSHAAGSTFFFDDKIENVREASQMATGDRFDLNSAFVVGTSAVNESVVLSHFPRRS
jgi:hypothetical protein